MQENQTMCELHGLIKFLNDLRLPDVVVNTMHDNYL